ncbi:unnamed protein product [Rotaria magnacalcarata]|uniref:Uncharacterized protein n=1 Tax=Rotaria magnacalcarata TaxID=392030 RepID=A0A819ID79_9BILA|nr:unnamed protein product [Rotaria magnacalcarata]CAF1686955.1 unnamed protein product [Rotaria magnacalcarata]CAF1939971.1 unnamed protein product [Rotaria magnacalcarata]CAF1957101.1 unnamed protein product [Rotaria magnacalcarata]CAF2263568.1 unnamed protein product [Rotaria magnacalcarata]
MSTIDISPTPDQSHPLSFKSPSRQSADSAKRDSQANDAFLQYLFIKQPINQQRNFRKSNTNFATSIGSMVDRAPSSLFELKQQRILAAADRKKRIIARIVSIVGLFIIILCAAIVTLTLKMAPKIDELVRNKVGTHQSMHIVSRMDTSPRTTTVIGTTLRQYNSTQNGSVTGKSIFRT